LAAVVGAAMGEMQTPLRGGLLLLLLRRRRLLHSVS
jgi:hypothetical protein